MKYFFAIALWLIIFSVVSGLMDGFISKKSNQTNMRLHATSAEELQRCMDRVDDLDERMKMLELYTMPDSGDL